MFATSALFVLASTATLLVLADAKQYCNSAIIGDFEEEKTEEFTSEKIIAPGQAFIQIKERCNGPFAIPAYMQVTACDDDRFPQVYLRPVEGEVHRFGNTLSKATVTINYSCILNTNSGEFEYV
ncbi:uncharacterized protein LOC113501507 [Trichoplusia ni]|uniref:Uncharacterized protein LOC113501507 n=1 Tax=Trichoplusia ni TaxID=7111 RepID=A0A7E5WCV5_TRINI|nr:uncharacterized protein LOC113501507 [Trichoplusia ni]